MKKCITLLSLLVLLGASVPSQAMFLRNTKLNNAQLSKTPLVKNQRKSQTLHAKKYSKKSNNNGNNNQQSFKTFNNDYKKFSLSRLIGFGGLVSAFYSWWNGDEKKEQENENKIFSIESLEDVPSYIHIVKMYEDPHPMSLIKKTLYQKNIDAETLKKHSDFSCDEEYLRYVANFILINLYENNNASENEHIINTIVTSIYKEKKIFSENNIALYHGISGSNYVLLDIYKRLYEELTKTKYNDFLFLRFHNTCNRLSKNWQTNFLEKEMIRHENNTPDKCFDETDVKNHLLSTNMFIMGNLDEWQCSSFIFSMYSFNLFFQSNKEQIIFKMLQKSLNTNIDIQKYFKEIQQKSFRYGVLFQITTKGDEFIYMSAPGGKPLKSITVKDFYKNIKNFESFQLDNSQARLVLDKDVVEKQRHYITSIEKYYPNPDANAYYNSKEYIQMREGVVQQILHAMIPLEKKMIEKDPRIEWQAPGFSL